MIEVKGKSPGGNQPRIVKVYVRSNGRVDLWVCPPGTPANSSSGFAISDVVIEELQAALKSGPSTTKW